MRGPRDATTLNDERGDEGVADHIGVGEPGYSDAVDIPENIQGMPQAAAVLARQGDLGRIPRHHDLGAREAWGQCGRRKERGEEAEGRWRRGPQEGEIWGWIKGKDAAQSPRIWKRRAA